MSFADILCLAIALGSFGLLTWRSVTDIRFQLPAAQALQALSKLKDNEDEKLRTILSRFQEKSDQKPDTRKQFEELTKRAEQWGFTPNLDQEKIKREPVTFAPVTTAPDADEPWVPFVE